MGSNLLYNKLRFRVVTLVGLAVVVTMAWLSYGQREVFDWTASGRHSLGQASIELLARFDGEIVVTLFIGEQPDLRYQVERFIKRYQRYYPDFKLRFVDPAQQPQEAEKYGVSSAGEIIAEYGGRRQRVPGFSEEKLTTALFKLQRASDRWILFLGGHGERSSSGKANFDVGTWADSLRMRGWPVQTLNLGRVPLIPDNTAALVIASPQVDYLAGEVQAIQAYLERGGNLLWLREPGGEAGLESLAETLGVAAARGTVLDPTTGRLGINNPAFALAADYGTHVSLAGFKLLTVFPYATSAALSPVPPWQASTLVVSAPESWLETSPLSGEAVFDPDSDMRGPVVIATALTRPKPSSSGEPPALQRVLVVGDGDFVSNTFIGNGGNKELGTRWMEWVAADDALLNVSSETVRDLHLELAPSHLALIGFGFLFGVPGCWVLWAGWVWWSRRRA